jgi:hypothetical protein
LAKLATGLLLGELGIKFARMGEIERSRPKVILARF